MEAVIMRLGEEQILRLLSKLGVEATKKRILGKAPPVGIPLNAALNYGQIQSFGWTAKKVMAPAFVMCASCGEQTGKRNQYCPTAALTSAGFQEGPAVSRRWALARLFGAWMERGGNIRRQAPIAVAGRPDGPVAGNSEVASERIQGTREASEGSVEVDHPRADLATERADRLAASRTSAAAIKRRYGGSAGAEEGDES